MIDIQDLGVQFGGVKPIDGLTVQLTKQIVGLIGPNGAGKTTLLNVLSGFVVPVRGRVSVDGQDLTGVAPHRRAALGLRRTFPIHPNVAGLQWGKVFHGTRKRVVDAQAHVCSRNQVGECQAARQALWMRFIKREMPKAKRLPSATIQRSI